MKWYKKQLMELEKNKPADNKKDLAKNGPISTKKKAGHSFDAQKIRGHKSVFPNPVSNRNRNRPKTDCI